MNLLLHRPENRCLESARPTCYIPSWRGSREEALASSGQTSQERPGEEEEEEADKLLLRRGEGNHRPGRRRRRGLVQQAVGWRRHPWRLTSPSWSCSGAGSTSGRELWRALEMAATSLLLGIVLLVTPGQFERNLYSYHLPCNIETFTPHSCVFWEKNVKFPQCSN